ncbi:MAG: hypothetical protein PHI85_09300 [Victivallaceae bacterium]|nr:hypothetical protein [Victivallaceae bacterium]
MNTRQVLKLALTGCDREEAAKAAGMSLGSLNNQISGELPYLPKGKTQNVLDRVYNLIDVTFSETGKMVILEKLAEEWGFMLIANPVIRATDCPAVAKIAEIMREFAAVIDETARAITDGRIEKWEAEKIRERWEIVKRLTEEFVLACETGVYQGAVSNDKK